MRPLASLVLLTLALTACAKKNGDSRPGTEPAQQAPMTEHHVTMDDIARIMGGEGGIDCVPVVENGQTVGMRIVGLTPGTTADRLGARNGDTIESLNDVPLSGVAAAYAAADSAVKDRRIVVRGKRDGAPYTTVLVLD